MSDVRSLYRNAALAIEKAVDIAEAQEILFDLALQPSTIVEENERNETK